MKLDISLSQLERLDNALADVAMMVRDLDKLRRNFATTVRSAGHDPSMSQLEGLIEDARDLDDNWMDAMDNLSGEFAEVSTLMDYITRDNERKHGGFLTLWLARNAEDEKESDRYNTQDDSPITVW
jgi:hypothetical protein